MIPFAQIGKFVIDAGSNNLRVMDFHKNKLGDIFAPTAEQAWAQLQQKGPLLAMYGKIIVKGANDEEAKGHFARGMQWNVYFENAGAGVGTWQTPGSAPVGQQTMNAELLSALVKINALEGAMAQKLWQDNFEKLHKKKDEFNPTKFLPLAGPLLGWDDAKVMKTMYMMAAAENPQMLSGVLQGPGATAAGPGTGTQLSFQGTKEEKEKVMEKLWDEIGQKVDGQKMYILLNAINKNPQFADTAVQFLGAQGLAGTPADFLHQEQKQIPEHCSVIELDNNSAQDEEF